jgi:hypothetical protein
MLALGVALAQLGVALTALALLVASSARLDERKPDERKPGGGAPRTPDGRRADCARAFSTTILSQLRLVVALLILLFGDAPSMRAGADGGCRAGGGTSSGRHAQTYNTRVELGVALPADEEGEEEDDAGHMTSNYTKGDCPSRSTTCP